MEEDNDPLKYDVWIEDALRMVIRRTLTYISANGLPGDHHFYITFRTSDDKVKIPDYLRAEHPEEMTIVLQYQYDALDVDEHAIYTTLRFNGKPESMVIPLSSIVSFADPSVNFGLQLKMASLDDEDLDYEIEMDLDETDGADELLSAGSGKAGDDDKRKSGEVIALDAFRKK
ncbi:MAG: hypothetical protein HQ483_20580 [Rhodospirillales bacterium]|nr:hypothetical protein [Rhodospirillales bacterium]